MPNKGEIGFRRRTNEQLQQVEDIYQRYRHTYTNNHDTSVVKTIPQIINNCHDHAFVTECCQFRTTNINDAVKIVQAILGDY